MVNYSDLSIAMDFVGQPGYYVGYTTIQTINETSYDCFYSGLQTPQYCVNTCYNEGK